MCVYNIAHAYIQWCLCFMQSILLRTNELPLNQNSCHVSGMCEESNMHVTAVAGLVIEYAGIVNKWQMISWCGILKDDYFQ